MEKKTYEKPVLHAERFTPNEYVAVCWLVACAYETANTYEKTHYRTDNTGWGGGGNNRKSWWDIGCSHDAAHCGNSTYQVIYDEDDNGVAEKMIETGTDGLGDLECTLYTTGDYETTRDISTVSVGNYIYWTTTSTNETNGTRIWHHQGTVIGKSDTKKNMS